jgi:peroxiredoxin
MFSNRLCLVLALLFASSCGASSPAPAASATPPKTEPAQDSLLVTEALGHPHIGEQAPDFELPDQNGNPVKLSSLRGSPVVLALAASWCPFSKAEQPHLAELAQSYEARGVKTLAVVIADTEDGYKKYVARAPMPFPVLRDLRDEVGLGYAPEHAHPSFKDRRKVAVTANLVIDKDGVIRHFALADTAHFDAELSQVRAVLDQLLAAGT